MGDRGGPALARRADVPQQLRRGREVAGFVLVEPGSQGARQHAADRGYDLKLGRALVDVSDAGVAGVTLDGEVAHVARAAVDLQRVVGDPVGHLGGAGLGQRREEGGETGVLLELGAQLLELVGGARRALARLKLLDAALEALLAVDDHGRLVEQRSRGFEGHLHVGQHGGHCREVADRPTELHALVGILGRGPVRGLGDALSLGGDGDAGAVHEAHDVRRQAAPALADEQRRCVVELQLAGRRAVDAELVFEAADRHVLVAFVEEHRQAAGVGRAFL